MLNSAREAIPTDHTIWVSAAKLEEAQGNSQLVDKIISRAVKKLSKHELRIKRDLWLQEAVFAEQSDSIVTCRAIIKHTMHYGLEDLVETYAEEKEKLKQVRQVWLDNAEACVKNGAIESARALLFHAITEFPTKKSLYFEAIKLE